ncbi:MAG TPA: hypothetical protein VIM98_17700 [Dyella sp.]
MLQTRERRHRPRWTQRHWGKSDFLHTQRMGQGASRPGNKLRTQADAQQLPPSSKLRPHDRQFMLDKRVGSVHHRGQWATKHDHQVGIAHEIAIDLIARRITIVQFMPSIGQHFAQGTNILEMNVAQGYGRFHHGFSQQAGHGIVAAPLWP